mgnify:CR=1 FL=1
MAMEIIKTDWEASLNDMITTLRSSKYQHIDDFYTILTHDISLYIAIRQIDSYHEIMTTAKYCLSQGCRFDHKVYLKIGNDGDKIYNKQAQYVMNFHELKSAIVWYNSALDYILQIIYFGFGFHKSILTSNNFRNEQINVKWNKQATFYKSFENFAKKNQNAKKVFDKYNAIRDDKNVTLIRKLANHMKHHGGFDMAECIKNQRGDLKLRVNDKIINLNKITKREIVSYKKIVNSLMETHNTITTFGDYIIEQLGFAEQIYDMSNIKRLQKFRYK